MGERNWQNGFEKYKQRLSAISTWKGPGKRDRTHHESYIDLAGLESDEDGRDLWDSGGADD